jgi:TRAP transporter TAXI family solute receptor
MRRVLPFSLLVILLLVPVAHAADPQFITVGGGVGTFPIMAAKIADVINKEFPGVKASSIPGGSDLNLKNIQSGASQVGLSISMTSYQGHKGIAHFPQPLDKVRHVMSLYRGYIHYIASARSDIRSFADILKRPYRVYVGKVGTLHHVLMTEMLKANGITVDDIKKLGGVPNPVAYSDVVRMFQDGQLDVAMITGPVPYSMGMELAQSPGFRLLGVSDEARNRVIAALPGMGRAVIPKGTYKGQEEDIQTIAYMSHMVASSELSDDFVYRLVAAMVKHMPDMKSLFAGASEIRLESALLDNPIPVHPGAKRYYDEKGIK